MDERVAKQALVIADLLDWMESYRKAFGHLPIVVGEDVYQYVGAQVRIVSFEMVSSPEFAEVRIESRLMSCVTVALSDLEVWVPCQTATKNP